MIKLRNHKAAWLLLAGLAVALAACASKSGTARAPKPRNGIAEYRGLVDQSALLVGDALRALDRVEAQPGRCPPKVVAAFARQADRLQAESITIRARAQAIQARGDAYFENWRENLSRVEDPRVRDLAERRRPELEQRFANVKSASQQAGNAFRPFLTGLRRLQGSLEDDPAALEAPASKELLRATREQGGGVQQALAAIRVELDAMTALLTPTASGARH